jgi:hypothetical protein
VSRDHHDRRVDAPLPEAGQRRQPVDARQPDVEDDDVIRLARDAIQAGFPAIDRVDGIPLVAQHAAQRAPHAGLVVDDEDVGFHCSFPLPASR